MLPFLEHFFLGEGGYCSGHRWRKGNPSFSVHIQIIYHGEWAETKHRESILEKRMDMRMDGCNRHKKGSGYFKKKFTRENAGQPCRFND